MPLNIKDPNTEKVVRELAAITGEAVTQRFEEPPRSGFNVFDATNPAEGSPMSCLR